MKPRLGNKRIDNISPVTVSTTVDERSGRPDIDPARSVVWIWVNTVFIITSLKTEIARSARGQKLEGPRAEDAMAEPYLVQKMLVT